MADVSVRVALGKGHLRDAWAMRPYDFEEEQQTVQQKIPAAVARRQVTVKVPSFRYHTMLVFRVTEATSKPK